MLLFVLLVVSVDATRVWQPEDFQFNFYVFAQSWQAEFCRNKHYPGCHVPREFWKTHFTLHGLWPDVQHGKHPYTCTTERFDPNTVDRVGRNALIQQWPDVKYDPSSPNYDQFWAHEWEKHGTCSDLTQIEYFTQALRLLNNLTTPEIISTHTGGNLSTASVRKAFGGSNKAVLKCDDQVFLAQIFTCWDKDDQHRPTVQIPCPMHILHEDTCHSPQVEIQNFK